MTYRYRLSLLVLSTVAIFSSIVLVILSPLAFRRIANVPGINWSLLSNVGQTYGAVSAILAALGLTGVALSIFLQVREARHNRLQAGRTRQYELIRLAMDDPLYMKVFSSVHGSSESQRLTTYINLFLQYLHMLWDFNDLPEKQLRYVSSDLLGSQAGREYWKEYGDTWRDLISNKRAAKFYSILDEVYKLSVRSATENTEDSADGRDSSEPTGRVRPLAVGRTLVVGTMLGIGAYRLVKAIRSLVNGTSEIGRDGIDI